METVRTYHTAPMRVMLSLVQLRRCRFFAVSKTRVAAQRLRRSLAVLPLAFIYEVLHDTVPLAQRLLLAIVVDGP